MTLEEEQAEFYQALGRAVSQWAHVEHALFEVFCRLLHCPQWTLSSAAFHAIVGFRARLDMTDAAAQVALTDVTLRRKWKDITKALRDSSGKRRNRLVHWSVVTDVNAAPGKRVYLRPALLNINVALKHAGKEPPDDMPTMPLDKVKACIPEFGEISGRLIRFNETVEQELGRP